MRHPQHLFDPPLSSRFIAVAVGPKPPLRHLSARVRWHWRKWRWTRAMSRFFMAHMQYIFAEKPDVVDLMALWQVQVIQLLLSVPSPARSEVPLDAFASVSNLLDDAGEEILADLRDRGVAPPPVWVS